MHFHHLGAGPHDALGRRNLSGDIRLRESNAVEHDPPHKDILPQVFEKGKQATGRADHPWASALATLPMRVIR